MNPRTIHGPLTILALDLGTETGYAMGTEGYPLSCGTIFLAQPKELKCQKRLRMDRRLDMRFPRLVEFLRKTCLYLRPDYVVFEDVQFASTSCQAHLWATWRAAVWSLCHEKGIIPECCPVGTLKKFATGSGRAEKSDMARHLCQKNPRFVYSKGVVFDTVTSQTIDDNAVDALHLWHWAKSILK
jgi:hypothetical protein